MTSESKGLVRSESKELVRIERDPVPPKLYVDEGMVLIEQLLEAGLIRYPSAKERSQFDQAIRSILDDITRGDQGS